jgi:hypothetical protein
MDLKTYQAAKIPSFFSLGLKFAVNEDQLSVTGLDQFPPEDRPGLHELIINHKSEIVAEVVKIQNRLTELIHQADHSKGLIQEQIEAISAEGSEIISQLSPEVVRCIFKQ